MTTQMKMCCTECGGENVKRDAWAVWDARVQRWKVSAIHDRATCGDCEGDCRIEKVPVDLETRPDGLEVRHDMHGFYLCTLAEAEHEDAGHASAGFDGRAHYATVGSAWHAAKRARAEAEAT